MLLILMTRPPPCTTLFPYTTLFRSHAAKWSGFYFVYDRTGKEALLTKAILRLRAQDKEPPRITAVTLAGIPVVKVESKTDTSYWAETGQGDRRYARRLFILRAKAQI